MFRRILAAAALVALAVVLLLAGWPQLLGLERQAVIAQLVSLRGLAVLVAAAFVILFAAIVLASPRRRRFLGSVVILLLVFSAVTAAVLATRGFGSAGIPDSGNADQADPRDLTVLSWNTLGDAPGPEAIATLAIEQGADIVVLPETSAETAAIVAAVMTGAGHPMQELHLSLDEISKARTTALLVSTALGEYVRDDATGTTDTLPSLLARPADGSGPTIVAAHPVAPVPGEMAAWRTGLQWVADRCVARNVILAGDLNSTLDHYTGLGIEGGDLGRCHDAARSTGDAAVGTWPTALPPLLGAPIDHVMATDDWKVVAFEVIGTQDAAGSDHRPVVAVLSPSS